MTFPESQRVVYRQNPLVEVICQLRFPTILEIKAADPARFQERVRLSGYPLYERTEGGVPKDVEEILARLPVGMRPEGVTHKFLAEDESRFISLAPGFVALTEKRYTRWEHFREQLELAARALEEEHHPSFYSRIGLRYQDIIDKTKLGLGDEPWSSLVKPSIVGILGAEELSTVVQQVQTMASIRLDADVPSGFATLRHGLIRRSDGSEAYGIDIDLYTEERSASDHAFDILDGFNRVAGNFFRWAITPQLERALEPEPID
ncbi:MAG: TIGR04255 family protein [Dehalococcoidia bacterium]|nr:TIGR04255 family protein [Dehalococcoidia bacterium]